MLKIDRIRADVIFAICAGLTSLGLSTAAPAQDNYPSRPIRFVVPFSAGGSLDFVARSLGTHISKQGGVNIVVENRPGASGIIATELVKKAPADGYTVLVTNSATHVNNVGMFKSLPYDPVRDFQPIGMLVFPPVMLVSNQSVPAKNLAEFIAYAQSHRDSISFGTWGPGSYPHIAIEIFAKLHKFAPVVMVPYKSEPEILNELLAGRLTSAMASVLSVKAHVENGTIRAYATNGASRSQLLPDVPTFRELGYTDPILPTSTWWAAYLPAGTPKPIAEKLNGWLRNALSDPSVAKSFTDKGIQPIGSTIAEHQKELESQLQTFPKAMREAGIEPQ